MTLGVTNVASADSFDSGWADAGAADDAAVDVAPRVRYRTPGAPAPRVGDRGPRGPDAGVDDAATGDAGAWARPAVGLEHYRRQGQAAASAVHTQAISKGLHASADDEVALEEDAEATGCSATHVSGGSAPRLVLAWLIGLVVLRARRRLA